MSPFDLGALLLLAAALIGFINDRWIGLPQPVCLLLGAIAVALAIMAIDPLIPSYDLTGMARTMLEAARLPDVLLDGVLAFLLFAASLHVDLHALRTNQRTILGLAIGGVLISSALFAGLIWAVLLAAGTPVPFYWCWVLGAILAPTDAVVVEGLLRRVALPDALKAAISGESLFNDGVGVVIFLVALAAARGEHNVIGHGIVAARLLVESAGGAAIGFVTGLIAAAALRRAADFSVTLTISLALVLATYRLALAAGVSGPIAVVTAGLVIGRTIHRDARSPNLLAVVAFWSAIDELLNVMLFLLIGLQTFTVTEGRAPLVAILAAAPLALVARAVSVAIPMGLLNIHGKNRRRNVAVLTWSGLRGGVSVALALGLPDSPWRGLLLALCYTVVVFSIVVQGLTMPAFIRRFIGPIEE